MSSRISEKEVLIIKEKIEDKPQQSDLNGQWLLLATSIINVIAFAWALIWILQQKGDPKYLRVTNALSAILVVALFQYAVLSFSYAFVQGGNFERGYEMILEVRYLQWIIMLPLIVFTFWEFARVNGYTGNFWLFLIPVVLFVVFMWLGDTDAFGWSGYSFAGHRKGWKWIFFVLALLSLAWLIFMVWNATTYLQKTANISTSGLEWYFTIGWLLYPLGFLFNGYTKLNIYNVADLINGAIYSFNLEYVLQRN